MRSFPLKAVGFVIVLILLVALAPFGTVPAGHRGVMTTFGSPSSEVLTTAEQLKLKAERDLQRIEVEARQRVAQAKAEAESLAVQRQQVTPELIRLREMENQRQAIEKWDGRLPNVAGGAIPFINVSPAK